MKKIEAKIMPDDTVMLTVGFEKIILSVQEASQLEWELYTTINNFLKEYEANQS